MAGRQLIFQLGTNNWQRGGEFAPGSGILHEAHHRACNNLPNIGCYSIYPSKNQRFQADDVKIFELDHDIPICESISPASSYRWHAMSDDEIVAYRARLTKDVGDWMAAIEARTGDMFALAIAHHTFLNPLVMRDVIDGREAAGKQRIPLLCFAHGTALKMYAKERQGDHPEEFPKRFLPMIEREGIFDYGSQRPGVDLCAAISTQQIDTLVDIFPSFPRDRVILSHNGYNQDVFSIKIPPTSTIDDRLETLKAFETKPYQGSRHLPRHIDAEVDAIVVFCGKFADWKRLDALLHAAVVYEQSDKRIATLIVGSGPLEDQVKMQDLALDQLGLRRTYFLGPKGQEELTTLFNAADLGCFPSYNEPFGLVFIECMACGTPVIGANSGGPKDFVTSEVGTLVPETDDIEALAASLSDQIQKSLAENWKAEKGAVAASYAKNNYSVLNQVKTLLGDVHRHCPEFKGVGSA